NHRILADLLAKWGMRTVAASSAAAALEMIECSVAIGTPYPLILIDLQMPFLDGFDLATCIRTYPALAASKIVMMLPHLTANVPNGIDGSISKPVKWSDLQRAILTAFDRFESTPQPLDKTAPAPAPMLRILLAEDNLVNQRLAVRLLEKRGYEV